MSKISYKLPSLLTTLTLPLLLGCTHTNVGTDSSIHTTPDITSDKNTSSTLRNNSLNCQKIDKELTQYLKMNAKSSEYNAIQVSNKSFKNTLTNYTQQANSINCDFALARAEGLVIKTSHDKKLRVFAWDKKDGGTMRQYEGIYQFKDNNDTVHLRIGTGYQSSKYQYLLDGVPNALFTETLNGKVTYMLASTGQDSNKVHNQLLQLWTINGDTLKPEDIIKTNSIGNSLTFRYDFFSVVDRPERPIQLFEYDKPSKTIRFPIIIKTDKYPIGKVTDKFIEYRFDGEYFQRVKK